VVGTYAYNRTESDIRRLLADDPAIFVRTRRMPTLLFFVERLKVFNGCRRWPTTLVMVVNVFYCLSPVASYEMRLSVLHDNADAGMQTDVRVT